MPSTLKKLRGHFPFSLYIIYIYFIFFLWGGDPCISQILFLFLFMKKNLGRKKRIFPVGQVI